MARLSTECQLKGGRVPVVGRNHTGSTERKGRQPFLRTVPRARQRSLHVGTAELDALYDVLRGSEDI
jgi:hypothetical protein